MGSRNSFNALTIGLIALVLVIAGIGLVLNIRNTGTTQSPAPAAKPDASPTNTGDGKVSFMTASENYQLLVAYAKNNNTHKARIMTLQNSVGKPYGTFYASEMYRQNGATGERVVYIAVSHVDRTTPNDKRHFSCDMREDGSTTCTGELSEGSMKLMLADAIAKAKA